MAVVDELRHRLVTAGLGAKGASTSTTSIFVDSLPEWPRIAVVISDAGGQPGDRHYGNGVPDIERPLIDVVVRSTAPAGGSVPPSTGVRDVAMDVYRNLTAVSNEALKASSSAAASTYLSVEAISGPPYLFDRDSRGRLLYRCTFQVDRMSS